jgi:ABC-type dipeptide/oligopeptide/nickel transport system permease component
VQAGLLVLATAVVLVNTTFNVLYGVIDPRLRRS